MKNQVKKITKKKKIKKMKKNLIKKKKILILKRIPILKILAVMKKMIEREEFYNQFFNNFYKIYRDYNLCLRVIFNSKKK